MKRMLLFLVMSFGFGLTGLLASHTPAVAGGGFSNRDLSGEYVFNLAEIRIEYDFSSGAPIPVTDYCDVAGTLRFDGLGAMTVDGTRRCSFTGTFVDASALTYTVNPDGSFLVTDPADPVPDPVHGQIVNRGKSLLIDGTTRINPNVLMFHGVAMQR